MYENEFVSWGTAVQYVATVFECTVKEVLKLTDNEVWALYWEAKKGHQ